MSKITQAVREAAVLTDEEMQVVLNETLDDVAADWFEGGGFRVNMRPLQIRVAECQLEKLLSLRGNVIDGKFVPTPEGDIEIVAHNRKTGEVIPFEISAR